MIKPMKCFICKRKIIDRPDAIDSRIYIYNKLYCIMCADKAVKPKIKKATCGQE